MLFLYLCKYQDYIKLFWYKLLSLSTSQWLDKQNWNCQPNITFSILPDLSSLINKMTFYLYVILKGGPNLFIVLFDGIFFALNMKCNFQKKERTWYYHILLCSAFVNPQEVIFQKGKLLWKYHKNTALTHTT